MSVQRNRRAPQEAVAVRRPVGSDCAAFVAAMRASTALHDPWISPPTSDAAYRRWLARTDDGRCEHRLVYLGDRFAGFVTLSEIVRGAFQNAFVSYGGVATLAESGAMSAGLALVIDEAFGPLGLHRLEANVQPGNDRSLALVRRLGFQREGFSERYLHIGGEWRDHERWALRSEQWRAGVDGAPAGYAPGR